jgi:hypothetical protein
VVCVLERAERREPHRPEIRECDEADALHGSPHVLKSGKYGM